jgi:hypothetical protein
MATIITKNSQTASAVPSAASLAVGELAVNTADGKLYTEHTGGVVKEIIPSTVVDGGITAAKIATNAVTSDKINASAVTTAKIADANVTVAKLSASGTPSSSTFLRGDGSWQAPPAPTLADGSVTDPKLSNDLVGGTTWYPIQIDIGSSGSSSGGTWRDVAQFRCLRGGTFQTRARLINGIDFSAGVAYRLLINGSVVGTSSTTYPSAYAVATLSIGNVTISRGQILQIQAYHDSNNQNTYIGAFHIGLNSSNYATPMFTFHTMNNSNSGSAQYLPI